MQVFIKLKIFNFLQSIEKAFLSPGYTTIIARIPLFLQQFNMSSNTKVIGYIRVSTDTQDLEKQRHLLLEDAQRHQLLIGEFINVEVSSRRDTKERRIDELLAKLDDGDTLIVAELSRLGRNMLETLNIINRLGEQGVRIIFVRQPELSTLGGRPAPLPKRSGSPRSRLRGASCEGVARRRGASGKWSPRPRRGR